MFGLRWQAMLQGLAFVSHQLGRFAGAYGGGLVYEAAGSYTLAWKIGVSVGLAAGIIQIAFALIRPTRRATLAANGLSQPAGYFLGGILPPAMAKGPKLLKSRPGIHHGPVGYLKP
jgi:hypothetical protein